MRHENHILRFWRRALLALLAVLPAVLGCTAPKKEAPARPHNVILVSVDTLRADTLNCYGYTAKRATSPHADALARDGVLFERFLTASPWTTPAHLSLLTSLTPTSHGVTASFREVWADMRKGSKYLRLSDEHMTLAETLKAKGYKTAAFTAGGTLEPCIGFDQGFERYETDMFKLNDTNMGAMFSWLEENRDKRFFLFWHTFEVHAPYVRGDFVHDVLPAETAKKVVDGLAAIKPLAEDEVWPGGAHRQRQKERKVLNAHEAFNRDVCEAMYASAVHSADRWFGELVKRLKKLDLYDDALIIFTSDHGEEFSERRPQAYYNRHGHQLHEEMIHVPLILKLPGRKHGGKRVPQLARGIDVMPTVLALTGVPPANDKMQGAVLAPLWTTPGARWEELTALVESSSGKTEKKALVDSRYKYIIELSKKSVEEHGRAFIPSKPARRALYDLLKDPGEKTNLLAGKAQARHRRRAGRLERILKRDLSGLKGEAEPIVLDKGTVDRLKALGYVGD